MTRPITADERSTLEQRLASLSGFVQAGYEQLAHFFQQIGAIDLPTLLHRPSWYLPMADVWLQQQDFASASDPARSFLRSVFGAYLGELVIEKFQGRWLVCDVPESRFFLRYVVGDFAKRGDDFVVRRDTGNVAIVERAAPGVAVSFVDPIGATTELFSMRPPSFAALLAEVARDSSG